MRPHLYKRPCPSVCRSVGPLVCLSVMLSSKSLRNGLLRILNDTDSAGRDKKRDEEEGVTRKVKKQKSCKRTHHWPRWALFLSLEASLLLRMRVCPSAGPSIGPSIMVSLKLQ